MNGSARTLVAALVGIALVAALLAFGPAIVGGWIGAMPAAAAESLFTLVIFGPMLALGIIGRRLTIGAGGMIGHQPRAAAARGAALGIGGLILAVAYAWLAGTLSWGACGAAGPMMVLGLFTVAFQVTAEEALFRGWLQPSIAPILGTPAAIGLVATVFAALHLLGGATGALPLINLGLGGVLFGLLAARDGGIAGAVAAHLGWNAGEQLALGLDPNPGASAYGALIDLDLIGATHWGGSEQGLNASWAMTIALAVLIVVLLPGVRSPRRPHQPLQA